MRAPLAPNGCPMAIAPPWTFVLARSAPASLAQANVGLEPRERETASDPRHTTRVDAQDSSRARTATSRSSSSVSSMTPRTSSECASATSRFSG